VSGCHATARLARKSGAWRYFGGRIQPIFFPGAPNFRDAALRVFRRNGYPGMYRTSSVVRRASYLGTGGGSRRLCVAGRYRSRLATMLTEVMAFVPVAAVVICTPGPDTALTVRNALTGAVLTGLGIRLAAEHT